MERLTEKHYLGTDHYMKCSGNCNVDMDCIDCPSFERLVERLAAYEDTGLMPNDVTDMMAANGNAICEIVKLKEELQGAKNTAEQYAAINETLFDSNMKLGADRKDLINELCQYCGKYKQAHEGACDGCRWREM